MASQEPREGEQVDQAGPDQVDQVRQEIDALWQEHVAKVNADLERYKRQHGEPIREAWPVLIWLARGMIGNMTLLANVLKVTSHLPDEFRLQLLELADEVKKLVEGAGKKQRRQG